VRLYLLIALYIVSANLLSHQNNGKVHYLGNEALLIEYQKSKILFDPFFHNNFNYYTLVPEQVRKDIFANKPPYDNISAILVSHAHGDHFDANDVIRYLKSYPDVKLIAPAQAIRQLKLAPDFNSIQSQLHAFDLAKGQPAQSLQVSPTLFVEAVRIPHAGWPQRATVENLVFRVTMANQMVVMHMGDADPLPAHFEAHQQFWPLRVTNHAFPPYWFSMSKAGNLILNDIINTEKVTGIHVPTTAPAELVNTEADYFSKVGDTRVITIREPVEPSKASAPSATSRHLKEHKHRH
jgi:L-ascorbate metabolism protein UlaG (beta-lactamase superfamily)